MTRYIRQSNIEAAALQLETVLFNPATKQFCVLNETATHLWQLLAEPHTRRELAAELCEEFDGVAPEQAEQDVHRTLEELIGCGVVAVEAGDRAASS